MSGIDVNIKEVERLAKHSGKEAEVFFKEEASASQSENIIPIKKVPKMYICMDGTGVPVVKKEAKNRKGKSEDGIARTREVKLGCIFTQTTVDEKGFPVRDEGSTSYTGGIERAEEFSDRIYSEAVKRGVKRGVKRADKVYVIGDGAP